MMKKAFTLIMGLSMMFTLSALAGNPTKQEIAASKATYSGNLKKKDGGGDWSCTATVQGEGVVQVKWASNEATYKGEMGPAGGKAGNPIVMNGTGSDGSQVRFQWDSLDKLQVEWWPNMAEKAGQSQNKPAHVMGTIPRK